MPTTLTYGSGATCLLDSSEVTHVRPNLAHELSVSEVRAQVQAAFACPVGYPPLARATVPDDQIVLALESGTPCLQEIVEGALEALRDSGVEFSDLTLLLSQGGNLQEEMGQLATSKEITLAVHDPDDEKSGSILGVTKAGRPLRLNRLLCDADFVLSIGVCTLSPDTEPRQGKSNGLFPIFSDRETIERYRAPIATDSPVIRIQRENEIEESGWLLGLGLTVQVVPSLSDGVAAVLAGEPGAVAEAAAATYRRIWSYQVNQPANLVIATVTGHSSQQTWESIGRTLRAASQVLEPGGAIAIYSELAELPGPSLGRLAGNEDFAAVEREIMRDRFSDSWASLRLCRALQRGPVFLRSQLSTEVVESLGMAPLGSDEELSRLVHKYENCIALDGAQRLLLSIAESP